MRISHASLNASGVFSPSPPSRSYEREGEGEQASERGERDSWAKLPLPAHINRGLRHKHKTHRNTGTGGGRGPRTCSGWRKHRAQFPSFPLRTSLHIHTQQRYIHRHIRHDRMGTDRQRSAETSSSAPSPSGTSLQSGRPAKGCGLPFLFKVWGLEIANEHERRRARVGGGRVMSRWSVVGTERLMCSLETTRG